MDILRTIKKKAKILFNASPHPGLNAVILHIELAEKYWDKARKKRDDDLFTDVIYRTNHAFEGILKEAYALLEGKDPSQRSPFEIENYLETNQVFEGRVLDLFRNYRKQWRNPSTHDYKLFFSESESFLAIVNVSAFIAILLDQMIRKVAYEKEKCEIGARAVELKSMITNYEALSLLDKSSAILQLFAQQTAEAIDDSKTVSEARYAGMLRGFVNSISPDISVRQEVRYNLKEFPIFADFVFEQGNKKVIIETRLPPKSISFALTSPDDHALVHQLSHLLEIANIRDGIIFYFPRYKRGVIHLKKVVIGSFTGKRTIVKIYQNVET